MANIRFRTAAGTAAGYRAALLVDAVVPTA